MKIILQSFAMLLAILLPTFANAHDFEVDGIYYNINGNEATVTYQGTSYSQYSDEYSGSICIPATVTFNGKMYQVTSIGQYAFYDCLDLTSISIPNSITSIGRYAFSGTSLTNVTIPYSVISIKLHVFSDCTKLSSIVVASDNPIYDSRNNCNAIIETSSNKLWLGCKNTIIPNTVKAIGNYAFDECYALRDIVIPNSVDTIGFGAFSWCSYLTNVRIPNSVTVIGNYAFQYCINLTNISISNSVTVIGGSAFKGCSNLANIVCYATTPPTCGYGKIFPSYSATLHVPAASLAAYFTTPEWSYFENIVGDAVEPTGIFVNKDSIEVQLGEQINLMATVIPTNASDKDVTWSSSDTTIAIVDNGNVTAMGYGECDIIAICYGMQAICHISVANRIKLDKQEMMILPNHILTLTPTATDMPNGFTATSSDPTVAATRVVSGGKIQVVGIKEGTATITIGSTDGTAMPATCLVTVYTEPGDLNSDGFINIGDVTSLIDYLLCNDSSQISTKNADVNGDDNINIADVTTLIDQLLTSSQ